MNGQIKFMNLYLNNAGLRHFEMNKKFHTEMSRLSFQTFTS